MTSWRTTTKMIGCTGALRLDSSTARPRGIAPPRGTPTNLAKFLTRSSTENVVVPKFLNGIRSHCWHPVPDLKGAHGGG